MLVKGFCTGRAAVTVGVVVLVLALGGCSGWTHAGGSVIDQQRVAELKAGEHTKDDVASILGTPTSVATFDNNIWYYISKRTEKFAFFEPETVNQEVVVIEFDQNDVVQTVNFHNTTDADEVDMVSRSTPTRGRSMTVLEQVMGTALRQIGGSGGGSPDPFQR